MHTNTAGRLERLPRIAVALTLSALTCGTAFGGWVGISDGEGDQKPVVNVGWYDAGGIGLHVTLAGLTLENTAIDSTEFVTVSLPESPLAGQLGEPCLPVIRRLVAVPRDAEVEILVAEGSATILDLEALGYPGRLVPIQGPQSIDRAALAQLADEGQAPESLLHLLSKPLHYDKQAYDSVEFLPVEPVTLTPIGFSRDLQIQLLEIRPVAYNPASGELAVWPTIDVELRFTGDFKSPTNPRLGAGLDSVVLNPPTSTSRGGSGNYLIITAEDFAASAPLAQFVSAKTAQGFTVTSHTMVVGTYRSDVKAYIDSLWGTPDAPDYILIVGDAIYDRSNVTSNLIPTWRGGGSDLSYTDNTYACMDGGDDWMPDVPLGRFPVRTVDDLQNLVDKTLYVESGNYADPGFPSRAAFIASADPDAQGAERCDEIIATYMDPAGLESTRVYVSQGADTEDLSNAFNAGCFMAAYFGHAYGSQAWGSPYFDFEDVDALTNDGLYPFILSFTCSGGAFHFDSHDPTIMEKFLRVPLKGAAAGYGTTSNLNPYTWVTWGDLYRYMFQTIYADGQRELGPAFQAAAGHFIAYYGAEDPVSRDYMECFLLQGDPSLRLPEPPSKNYLIVTAEDYSGSAPLDEFIAAKEALGFSVSTWVATNGTSNTAIKSYIQSLWGTTDQPDYVLLVGDTDGSNATLNTVPHWQGGGDHGGATDWPYVCMDAGDDWYPEIPIGRFSVRTVTSLQNVVDKTLFVEAGNFSDPDYVKRGAFLANPGTYGQAEPTHDWVIDNYFTPNDYEGIKLYAAQGADTQDVTDAVNAGALFTVYFGHSGSGGWWDPSFTQTNVNALSNTGLYGLAMAWSCNTAHYSYDECFGETWLRAPNKGAAAYISASDYIYWSSVEEWRPSVIMEKELFASFFQKDEWEIGPALVSCFERFLIEYGQWDGDPAHNPTYRPDICRNFLEEFVILGDPSLRLPQPDGFTVAPLPAEHSLCAPPSTQALFTINVDQLGTFAEEITLSVNGAPTGATIEFSVNSQAPPFTSMLTIGNLAGVAPGQYDMLITGTSATKQRSAPATLNIADIHPEQPLLTSPANGETNVPPLAQFTWQPSDTALDYEIEIATNASFGNIVFQALLSDTSVSVPSPLSPQMLHYWRVRALNACGSSGFSPAFTFVTENRLIPESYDMLNGESGQYSYYDDEYNGDGNNNEPLAPLSGGLGDLTDGVIATGHWNALNTPYVGWHTIEPTITFHFAEPVVISELTIHVDDDGGGGGVVPPSDVVVRMGLTQRNFTVTDPPASEPFAFTCTDLNMFGDTLELTLEDDNFTTNRYMMLSEVEFNGGPNTGACCNAETCSIETEVSCLSSGGTYHGDATSCDPNPCIEYDSACLIFSEIVLGTESGGCPRWVEITNTGTTDFAFLEGGLIVQTDDDTDVYVDINLAGVVIEAGQSFVINSNAEGVCTGAFDAIYPIDADLHTTVPFGFGNERFIITDTTDGSHLIDIYGEFGVNGTGQPWEFTNGYSYRLPAWNAGTGGTFAPEQWFFGGVDSLEGENPTELLLDNTNPATHRFDETCTPGELGDMNCDGEVDFDDIDPFVLALSGQAAYEAAYPDCRWLNADCNESGDVGFDDIDAFVAVLSGD